MIELNDNGAWSWFMDERVIIHGDYLAVGSVRSAADSAGGSGNVEVSIYHQKTGSRQVCILHENFEEDDHDGPAFHIRPDGRVTATYTKHSQERRLYWRISTDETMSQWGPIQSLKTPGTDHPPFGGDNVTYTNLLCLADEGDLLYNFFRSVGHQQNWMTSEDHGETWRYRGMFLRGYQGYAPYFKYATNHRDTIHFVGTEDHPRNFDNSVYHGMIRGGVIHQSDGTSYRPLSETTEKSGDIWDLTCVYRGDQDHVAWVHDLHLDPDGRPACVFSVQRDGRGLPRGEGGKDHRYHYARWDGSQWSTHEIAYAGRRLYRGEDDYTGGICLDPQDLARVVISTDVDPRTGRPLISRGDGLRHRELFLGRTDDGGETFSWSAITADSTDDHLRPIIPAGYTGPTPVCWMRGRYEHNQGPWSTSIMLGFVD